MFLKSLILSSVLFLGVSTFAAGEVGEIKRVPSKCWNTKLDNRQKATCGVCAVEVEGVFEKSCEDEIFAVDAIQFTMEILVEDKAEDSVLEAVILNFQKALTLRDNCKTNLINACFSKE